jgi:methylated-DNA-[protein]-cysteine S-methyltransferase
MVSACTSISSPIGTLHLSSNGDALTELLIVGSVSPLTAHACSPKPDRVLTAATSQLSEYFGGRRTVFNLPVVLTGTEFQQSIWQQLRSIAFGETRGYGELGAAVGKPTAARAVGGCVGANPIAIVIPCHRVLASDRRITGFSGGDGIATKRWLLEHEGIAFRS